MSAGNDVRVLQKRYDIPMYKGNAIDLSDAHIFTLYKGEHKTFVDDGLDDSAIYKYTSKEANIWWIEAPFYVAKEYLEQGIWLYYQTHINASEIYLNGKKVLSNGVVGRNSAEEKSGSVIVTQHLKPRDFKPENILLIKFSNQIYPHATSFKDIILASNRFIFSRSVTWVYAPLILGGFFLLAICVNFSLYIAFKKDSRFLLLSLFFLVNLISMIEDIILNSANPTLHYIENYYFGHTIQYLIYALLTSILLKEFHFKERIQYIVGGLFLSLALVLYLAYPNRVFEFFLALIPMSVSFYAVWLKKRHAKLLASALILLVILTYLDDYNIFEYHESVNKHLVIKSIVYYFSVIGILVFAFVMVYISGVRILEQQRALDATKLKSARLENELLQKHISPHFIMNSLMSLQELIDIDKEKASEMIDSLSEEFHLLATISKEKQIPLSEEIEICRVHLKIMGIQQRSEFRFEAEGLDGTEMIPPAVIHTLVENGITHGYSGTQHGFFHLKKSIEPPYTVYTLFNDSQNSEETRKNGSKTGLNYVRARLEESYPSKWELCSEPVEGGWKVTLKIENE